MISSVGIKMDAIGPLCRIHIVIAEIFPRWIWFSKLKIVGVCAYGAGLAAATRLVAHREFVRRITLHHTICTRRRDADGAPYEAVEVGKSGRVGAPALSSTSGEEPIRMHYFECFAALGEGSIRKGCAVCQSFVEVRVAVGHHGNG